MARHEREVAVEARPQPSATRHRSPAAGLPNRVTARLLASPEPEGVAPVRRALLLGSATDPAEVEADRAADEIVARLHERGGSAAAVACLPDETVARLPAPPDALPRHGLEGGALDARVDTAIQGRRGGGSALPAAARAAFEDAFGADLGGVRVHRGGEVDRLGQSLQAKAFTVGRDVFLTRAAGTPGTATGDRVLAHELAHTIQQGGAPLLDGPG